MAQNLIAPRAPAVPNFSSSTRLQSGNRPMNWTVDRSAWRLLLYRESQKRHGKPGRIDAV